MKDTIVGLFGSAELANMALQELTNAGYTEADVSVITKEDNVKMNSQTGEDIKTGAKTGGIVGGIVGLLVGIGALAIPGIGALFIAGPLAAAFGITGAAASTASGAITGALAGGLLGALKGIGVDDVQARVMEERIKQGDILLMVVPSPGNETEVKNVLEKHGAKHIDQMKLNI